jgi:Domain of unknown function (DUF222)
MAVNVEPSEADELLLDLGERLTTRRGLMDRGEAAWLRLLADFDRHELWQLDGQASCVDWLVWRAGLAVGTAYEKRRIAQELQRRPLLAEAFEAGDISYSAVRAITRLDDPDPEVDARLIDVAKAGTVRDLETLVLRYKNYADQERDPEEARSLRRGIRIRRGYDGLSTAEVTLTNLEIDEFVAALRAYSEHHGAPPKSDSSEEVKGAGDHSPQDDDPADPAASGSVPPDHSTGSDAVHNSPRGEDPAHDDPPQDDPRRDGPPANPDLVRRDDPAEPHESDTNSAAPNSPPVEKPIDDSPRGDDQAAPDPDDGPRVRPAAWQRRADALLDILRMAMEGGGEDAGIPTGADHYLVHLVHNPATGESQQLDGTPISREEADRILCHASTVTHTYGPDGDLLHLGRRTRDWNIHQERAIHVRDGGQCRFPGCAHRICDIHHLQPWGQDGPTDIENGASLCRYHHTLIHKGFKATGNANGTITFQRPDGTLLDTTAPLARYWQMAA